MSLPVTALVDQMFAALEVKGRGGLDHSALLTYLEHGMCPQKWVAKYRTSIAHQDGLGKRKYRPNLKSIHRLKPYDILL